MVLTPYVLTGNLNNLWQPHMDPNENYRYQLASDLERRVIRIETRLTRLMRHFNLDNEGALMTQPSNVPSPLVNDEASQLNEMSSVQHWQGADRMCLSTSSEEFSDKLRAVSTGRPADEEHGASKADKPYQSP